MQKGTKTTTYSLDWDTVMNLESRLLRDFQTNKVDIVHKYNLEQTQSLINNKQLSDVLINQYYKNSHKTDKSDDTHIIFDDKEEKDENNKTDIEKGRVSSDTDDSDDIDDI
jgi:hypothetical protein